MSERVQVRCPEKFMSRLLTIVSLIRLFDPLLVLGQRSQSNPKIEMVWNTTVEEIYGEKTVTGVKTKNVVSGETTKLAVSGLFWAIGTTALLLSQSISARLQQTLTQTRACAQHQVPSWPD